MKKTFMPSMILLDTTLPVGKTTGWGDGTSANEEDVYMDPDGVTWFWDGDQWVSENGDTLPEIPEGWDKL